MANKHNYAYEDLGFSKVDHQRASRKGFPEVIFCKGKTPAQVAGIFKSLAKKGHNVLATRAGKEMFAHVKKISKKAIYDERARAIYLIQERLPQKKGKILIATGGTSDIPVAEEAAITAEIMGNAVERLYDVGVAGLHRLLSNSHKLSEANVVVVVAGMEGALASVVGGLTDRPVIAVPTSIGYGANFQGIAPLLTMLNSCAPGVVVVNIDNGFGAGYFASVINK
ncbi:MAG TPA: nickel pincer cofactor biosynthesis protein LarB [Candidatus Norongarragalinales archaeon]|nr:nickel pincer cofactor biosynthesis protein LarB [Candidatus Norongarragalinales archaeon]